MLELNKQTSMENIMFKKMKFTLLIKSMRCTKKLIAFAMSAVVFLSAQSTIEFNVDMRCSPVGFSTVTVTGPFCNWCGSEGWNDLSDPDGDGIFTMQFETNNTTVEYKYMVDNWSYQENLIDDMQDGADCAPVTDYSGYANRLWDSNEDGDYVMDTFDQCDACIPDEEVAYIHVSEEQAAPGENASVIVNVHAAGYMVGAGSFTGEYYQGNPGPSPEFGELVLTRQDPVIDFYWGEGSPDPSMEAEYFQVRWTGDVYANEEGSYQFRTWSDDGVRLMVDGDTLIDQWYEFGGANFQADVTLEHGYHEVVLEYYENGGGAGVTLWWVNPEGFQNLVRPEGEERVLNAAEFQFAGFQNHPVDFTGISLDPSLDDWSMDFNNTDSVLYVAMAGANGVHMSELGTLFTLDFQVNDDAPEGDIPVDVVHGVLNAHSPYWQVEQGGIWVGVADFPPTEFDLLSPDDGSTVYIDQSNLNESTAFSWEASTDPEGNDVRYAVVFDPLIILPDGTEFWAGPALNFLESNSTSIPHQDIVGALSAQGATTGGVWWNVVASDGEFFPALNFFGGHVEVPNSDNLNFGTDNFAISLWFEHYGQWDSLQVSQQLLVKHNVDSDRYEIQLNRMDDGMVSLAAYVGDDVMSANREVHTNHIYHLVLSRNNGFVTMYMDGENVGEMTSAGNTTSDESLFLGMDPYYGEPFYGNMTDVTMYSSGLSPESVTTLFEDGFQSPINISEETSLVAHWPMEGDNQDPSSTTDWNRNLEDVSGNQNNGTLSDDVMYWAVQTGNYLWSSNGGRFVAIDISNALSVDDISIPMEFALHQNYPNPFNPTTSISYAIPNAGKVTLVIYDMMGREVRTLVDNNMDVGYQSATWDATNNLGNPVGAGVYIYQIQADGFTQSKKMILLK